MKKKYSNQMATKDLLQQNLSAREGNLEDIWNLEETQLQVYRQGKRHACTNRWKKMLAEFLLQEYYLLQGK